VGKKSTKCRVLNWGKEGENCKGNKIQKMNMRRIKKANETSEKK